MSMLLGAAITSFCASPSLLFAETSGNVAEGESVAESVSIAAPVAVSMSDDLSERSDTELTALTAQWGNLSPADRRRLLAEVRGRMVKSQSAPRQRLVGVRVQRKYGRIVRKSDGSVVVQTRVVQVVPQVRGQANQARGRVTFGFGFERRSKSNALPATNKTSPETLTNPDVVKQPPAMTVSQQQTPTEH